MGLFDVEDLPARLRSRIDASGPPHPVLGTPCWMWLGRLNRNGYGRAWDGEREPVVHRVVYELLVGPVPEGMILDHLCRNHPCCNPGHQEPVTYRENTLRGDAVLFRPNYELVAA